MSVFESEFWDRWPKGRKIDKKKCERKFNRLSRKKQIAATDGRWFTVRIMPYRTLENRIDGVVITFSDITAAKKLEAQLRQTQAVLEKRVAEQEAKGGQSNQ